MPLILLGPLLGVAVIALGVRSRRATGTLALLAALGAGVGVALAGAAQFRKTTPYDGSYEWVNVATAFSGPARFQTFITDFGVRVSHLNTVLLAAALAISLVVVIWSRAGARGEPSPARYYGLLTLLLFATLGTIGATDLAEIYVFWGIAAVASYLLLSNTWADPLATRAARLSLALPALTDLCLLAGIALLYSRYGQLNIDQLIPAMPALGPQPKTLAVATLLILTGAAGRLGLFPFQGWLTGAGPTPTGALAAVQGMWTLMVAGLLYKVMPIVVSADLLTHSLPGKALAATAAVSAVLLPLLALASPDVRKAVTAAGIAVSAVAVLAFARPGLVAPAVLLLAATALARTAAVLAAGTLAGGMRTAVLAEMGEGWRRMRLTVAALPLAAVGLTGGVAAIAGTSLRWYWGVAYAIGAGLAALVLLRVYLQAGHSLLPRRRGFDPTRVRPAPELMSYPPLLLGALAVALAVALYSTRFLGWADNQPHAAPAGLAYAWLAAPSAGILLGVLLFFGARASADRLAALVADRWEGAAVRTRVALDRLLVEPALDVAGRAEESLLSPGEEELGRLVAESGAVVRRPLPLLPVVIGLAVLVAVIAGLLAPGVYR